ncbi:MAG: DegT/DnrJ/EryC1/StrS family aminotransferase [Candidatus Caldatribacteriaceae bacterium]
MEIPLSKPCLGEEEKQAVLEVLDSGFLARGRQVELFEEEFARYIGVREAIATSSGTSALFVALKALGVREGDRVVTTPFTFVATASTIVQCGGTPIFCDVDEETFNLDPSCLEAILKREKSVKGVVLVHLYGLPCDMDAILTLKRQYGFFLLEDCAQAHGASYQGKKVGSFGEVAAFSFYPTKNMTTGEGGMVVTDNSGLAEECRMLTNHGSKKRYYHEVLGYNFRMTDIAAAIGRVQLRKLEEANKKRRWNAAFYDREFAALFPQVITPRVPEGRVSVFHQYTLKVRERRDELLSFLRNAGVGCEVYYPVPLHRQPFLMEMLPDCEFPVAEYLKDRVLSIPVHPQLSEDDLRMVVSLVREFFSR